MIEMIKPVRVGIVMGLLTLIFGICWVIVIETQHDLLHRMMSEAPVEGSIASLSLVSVANAAGEGSHSHEATTEPAKVVGGSSKADTSLNKKSSGALEAKAHKRLLRGHIHAMGLGLIVMVVSLILSATIASEKIKYVTSTCLGVGGFLYPFTWIIMGFFTVSFGASEAEKSVMILIVPTVLAILGSILTTLYFTYKTLFIED